MSYYYESKPDEKNYHYLNHKVCTVTLLHFHSAVEFLIVRRGRMLATVNGEEYVIEEGSGCFVDRFCLHSYSALDNNTEVYSFVGNSEIFESVFSDIDGVPPQKFSFSDFSLLDMAEKCYKDAKGDGARLAVFKGAIGMILSVISQNNSLLKIGERSSSDNICAVLRYISENFKEDISLELLASEFGYSPQYFSRMFHKYMNVNLTEYVNIARVNYAKKLLNSERNVAEVAFESGFGSMPAFYRAYKKVFGELPRG